MKSHKKQSLPVRGAWIEIAVPANGQLHAESLPVRGAWIEIISICHPPNHAASGRSPCGERGLKSISVATDVSRSAMSLPVRGAWIEIALSVSARCTHVSLPVRGAWIEIIWRILERIRSASLPVRGAWIEIANSGIARKYVPCRSPCGERGLKWGWRCGRANGRWRRSPCGERGLKSETGCHPPITTRPVAPRAGSVD